tara:strand:- start:2140 stop:2985 length:846 start_codon:yes stop_codon:yes gene_type:complete
MKFICGTYFKHKSKFQLTDYINARVPTFSYKNNQDLDNDYVFCRPEHITTLATRLRDKTIELPEKFNLITHNSDINFHDNEIKFVLNILPNIKKWYTQNLMDYHPDVFPIPIGIANTKWEHGNQDRFSKIIKEKNKKDNTFYANFNVSTNINERTECYQEVGIDNPITNYPNAASIQDHTNFVKDTQEKYLRDISKSYFTISPAGNGVDCHKTWEALYMSSIPIVTKWHGAERFKEMGIPILIIDKWSDFKNLKLTKNLYDDIWGDFDPTSLEFSTFIKND